MWSWLEAIYLCLLPDWARDLDTAVGDLGDRFDLSPPVRDFAARLVEAVGQNREKLDGLISAAATHWHQERMARLDALGPVKELAQLGAVLGREFAYDLLLKVSPLKEQRLREALAEAVREELFYQRGTPPEATYLFKHALVGDAAAWETRREKGIETLLANTVNGYRGMPPLGTCGFCSEPDLRDLIAYMAGLP